MAGTGYHSEGHVWADYRGCATYKFICKNCAEIAKTKHQDTECIDDC